MAGKSEWACKGNETQWLSVTKHSIGSKLGTNFDKIELRTNMYIYGNQGSQ